MSASDFDAGNHAMWGDDQMDRKKSSDFLTAYLLAESSVKVLNVNSPWGAGKSFFLRRWADELSQDHVCVFFNAWESDFGTEPLIALVTCIQQQTEDGLALSSSRAGKKVIDVSTGLIRAATPLIAKGLFRRFSGVEYDELIGELASVSAKGVIENLIKEQAESADNVSEFKKAVGACLSNAAENNGKKAPAFIFIDELDRCRPTYAIELLERVKHFFELEGCKFIIASDTAQLAHSVRAVYGEKFHSERYLSRFFDSEFRLDNRSIFNVVKCNMFPVEGMTVPVRVSGVPPIDGYRENVEFSSARPDTFKCGVAGYKAGDLVVVVMAQFFSLELREVLKCIVQLRGLSNYFTEMGTDFFLVAFLVFSKMADEDLYRSVFEKDVGASEFKRICSEGYSSISLYLSREAVSIVDVIAYYIYLFNLDGAGVRSVGPGNGWTEDTYYRVREKPGLLNQYRDAVELAHRLG